MKYFTNCEQPVNMDPNLTADLTSMRSKYFERDQLLLEENISKEPISQFNKWFQEAREDKTIVEPNAVALSTSNKDSVPKVHMVLCKRFGKNGFEFFTNYASGKAKNIAENPRVSMVFYWAPMNRCVYIQGVASKMSVEESDQYFHSRPRDNQISTVVSDPQSTPIPNRDALSEKSKKIREQYNDEAIPIPRPNWGGFRVIPHSIEFWQGQSDRLHDRLRFRKVCDAVKPDGILLHQGEEGWVYERLSP